LPLNDQRRDKYIVEIFLPSWEDLQLGFLDCFTGLAEFGGGVEFGEGGGGCVAQVALQIGWLWLTIDGKEEISIQFAAWCHRPM
jgi:hypothetical protein